jgi:hypothetical protein
MVKCELKFASSGYTMNNKGMCGKKWLRLKKIWKRLVKTSKDWQMVIKAGNGW